MDARAYDTLARTLWAEARSEGRAGLEAVAAVVLNRAAHPRWWGRDVAGVCLAPWQFSCWLPAAKGGQLERLRAVTAADPLFRLSQAVAAQALSGGLVDRTGGADSYANLHICSPAWARGRTPSAVIGAHTFFRLELPAPKGDQVHVDKPSEIAATHNFPKVASSSSVESESESDALNAAELARH
jgi:cell wall hydrolase